MRGWFGREEGRGDCICVKWDDGHVSEFTHEFLYSHSMDVPAYNNSAVAWTAKNMLERGGPDQEFTCGKTFWEMRL
eukprot:6047151-Amphidinium_carterae.1